MSASVGRLVPGPQARSATTPARTGGGPAPSPDTVGTRLTVRFTRMALDGAAVAQIGARPVAVPYAIPGEEAEIEITQVRPELRGRIVALSRKSAGAARPPCPHFGRCGGCQWQHLDLETQRRHKTAMVTQAFQEGGVEGLEIRACRGGAPWGYRNVLEAGLARRGATVIAGFHGWGTRHLYNIDLCPVQHPTNVRILQVLREAIRTTGLALYDQQARRGYVRGIIGMTGFASGEALAVLSTAAPIPDRMAFVRLVLSRVPGLVGLLEMVQPDRTPRLRGRQVSLLWGRHYIEEEMLGVRLRLDARTPVLPNPRTLPVLFDAICDAACLRGDEQVLDCFAEAGIMTLALAGRARRSVGVVDDRGVMVDAWAAAARNGLANAVFYTRDPGKVLAKLHERGERTDVVLLAPPGQGLPDEMPEALAAGGPRRLVYAGRSLSITVRDVARLHVAGYIPRSVQPVDLFPQTSHVHTVVALDRR